MGRRAKRPRNDVMNGAINRISAENFILKRGNFGLKFALPMVQLARSRASRPLIKIAYYQAPPEGDTWPHRATPSRG